MSLPVGDRLGVAVRGLPIITIRGLLLLIIVIHMKEVIAGVIRVDTQRMERAPLLIIVTRQRDIQGVIHVR